jgi:hypothetical protein
MFDGQVRAAGADQIAVGALPMNFGREIGKGLAQPFIEREHTGFVARAAGLGRVVEEIVGEELIEQFPISAALHFLGIAADDGLGSLADVVGHGKSPSVSDRGAHGAKISAAILLDAHLSEGWRPMPTA